MCSNHVQWTSSTQVAAILQKCLESGTLEEARTLHSVLVETGWFFKDSLLSNMVIRIYGSFGRMREARAVFESAPIRNVYAWTSMLVEYARNGHLQQARMLFEGMPLWNTVSWNAMMAAYVVHQHCDEAVKLFRRMNHDGVCPDRSTFINALGAAASLGALPQGRMIEGCATERGFSKNGIVASALLNMYGKCGSVREARLVFDAMPERSIISWTGMVTAYAQNGNLQQGESVFQQMPQWSVVAWNAMLTAYARGGNLQEARKLFDAMPTTETVTWDIMLSAYAERGQFKEAKAIFEQTPTRCVTSWTIMLSSCCDNPDDAVNIFRLMPMRDVIAQNAMITLLGQCGHICEAKQVFDSMPHRNTASYNTMASHFAQNGHLQEALEMFQGIDRPNVVSWSVMIIAYAKFGQLEQAKQLFDRMSHRDIVSWNALISAYANQDDIECRQAIEMFYSIGSDVHPNELTYVSVLGACQKLGSLADVYKIHDLVMRRGFKSPLVDTALVDSYGKCGRLDEAKSVFDSMEVKDEYPWNALASSYGQNGQLEMVMHLYHEMVLMGLCPGALTFLNVIASSSHSGKYVEGRDAFMIMVGDYEIVPKLEHYLCMVDLFGRSGQLQKAEELVRTMPFEGDHVAWTCLMAACSVHADPDLAANAAANVLELNSGTSSPYALFSGMLQRGNTPLSYDWK